VGRHVLVACVALVSLSCAPLFRSRTGPAAQAALLGRALRDWFGDEKFAPKGDGVWIVGELVPPGFALSLGDTGIVIDGDAADERIQDYRRQGTVVRVTKLDLRRRVAKTAFDVYYPGDELRHNVGNTFVWRRWRWKHWSVFATQ